MFTNADIVKLRKRTNAGMMDCKAALTACEGNLDKATEWLREKGIAKAAKKADRIAAEGLVYSYIHMGGKIGVLVEINSETDFVARSEQFVNLCKDVAMHIAAANPQYLNREEVPAEALEHEKEILTQQALNEGKPANIVDKMVEGRVKKYYAEVCLMEQPFVKDPGMSVSKYVGQYGAKVSNFVRYAVGEGLQKREDNFAEEVMNQVGK